MKTKKEIIGIINFKYHAGLDSRNTSYSKINKGKEVWWLNIAPHKFENDVNLLLNSGSEIIWIVLPKGSFKDLSSVFKIRPDKNLVDLEISADKHHKYLIDVKSGGTRFDFRSYVKKKIAY